MARHPFLLLLVGLLIAAGVAAADPTEYRFAPGDVLEVSVVPQQGLDRVLTIRPDGKISYPVAGELPAAGLTAPELTEKLRAGLSRELINPRVTLTLKTLNPQAVPRVSLLGAVRNPGVFDAKQGTSLAEVLAAGGGPTPLADLHHVTITRPDGSAVTVDLAQTEKTGQAERNIPLQPGDLVIVPQGPPPTVLVLGEVVKPGSYEILGAARLLDAISLAGGPTTKADLRRVTLGRAGATGLRTLDLQPLLARGDTSNQELNVLLQPGDTILLGESDERVYVLGRVVKPDVYMIKPNDRILDALAKAGGGAGDGDISKAVLVRRGENGQPVAKALDLRRMMASGKLDANDLVRPGDVLYVPDKKVRHSPLEIANLVWPLTGLINTINSIR